MFPSILFLLETNLLKCNKNDFVVARRKLTLPQTKWMVSLHCWKWAFAPCVSLIRMNEYTKLDELYVILEGMWKTGIILHMILRQNNYSINAEDWGLGNLSKAYSHLASLKQSHSTRWNGSLGLTETHALFI